MIVDGRLYPLHLAVASQWKVHYFTSDMSKSAELRDEDAAFVQDMPRVLGASVIDRLTQIARVLDLDYGGIDFGIDVHGRVVVFEANPTMIIVPPPEGSEKWAYRPAPVDAVRSAISRMLLERTGRGG